MPASRRSRAGRISETEEFEEIKPEKERERMICIKKKRGGSHKDWQKADKRKLEENENRSKYQAEYKQGRKGGRKRKQRKKKNTCQVFNSRYLWEFFNSKTVNLTVKLSKITRQSRHFFS